MYILILTQLPGLWSLAYFFKHYLEREDYTDINARKIEVHENIKQIGLLVRQQ